MGSGENLTNGSLHHLLTSVTSVISWVCNILLRRNAYNSTLRSIRKCQQRFARVHIVIKSIPFVYTVSIWETKPKTLAESSYPQKQTTKGRGIKNLKQFVHKGESGTCQFAEEKCAFSWSALVCGMIVYDRCRSSQIVDLFFRSLLNHCRFCFRSPSDQTIKQLFFRCNDIFDSPS